MYYLIGLEGSDGSSNDVQGYFSEGATETNSHQLPCLEVFKQEINCVLRVFDKCPGAIFQKLECPGGILKFALLWGCIFIIWNSPLAFSLVFTPYLSNTVVSAKSPHYISCPCSTEAVGIAHKPPRSL